jgi:hypothetical protein
MIKKLIHFVHYCKEINSHIDNQWLNITQDEFDQFCLNFKYSRQFGTLSHLKPTAITSFTPTVPSATSSSSTPSHTVQAHVNVFKSLGCQIHSLQRDPSVYSTMKDAIWNDQAEVQESKNACNSPSLSTFTLTVAKDAFTYVLETVLENENVTRALKHEGIDSIICLVKLTDDVVDNLAYHNPDPNIQKFISLKWVKLVSLNPSSTMSIYLKRQTPLVMTGNLLPWMILTIQT